MSDVAEIVPSNVELAQRAAENPRANQLEGVIAGMPVNVEMNPEHIFTPGLCVRMLPVPAGTWVATKIHKTEHPYIVLAGELSVWEPDTGVRRIKAPYIGVTKPGTRRFAYAHTDSVWIAFHATTETNLEKIEDFVVHKHTLSEPLPFSEDALKQLQETIS